MRRGLVLALAVAALVALAGCSSPAQTPPDQPDDSAAPSRSLGGSAGATVAPESPVAGIVIDVELEGLDDVRGFTLRSSAGDQLAFRIGELENGDEFPPAHLTEHLAAASPVLVFFRDEGGDLVAYRIEDAG